MGTTAASVLDASLHKLIGDWIEEDVTTALATNTYVISTALNKWDDGEADHFNDWWVYITEYNNIAEDRKIYDYTTTDGACTVRGATFSSDSANMATCRFYRNSYTVSQRAINDAIRETYPVLYRPLEDRTLVTGNILPDNSFELWISSSNPSLYSGSNATLARTTSSAYVRGAMGTTSMKVTADAADGYAYISSSTFPRLLDLAGKTVNHKCWVYPETANDAWIQIYTIKADGTEQFLPEDYADEQTTAGFSYAAIDPTAPAGKRTLLENENQAINDDIVEIQIRFAVHTSGDYCYFDSARLTGSSPREHLLLSDFADGGISRVYVQTAGSADDICDDLHPRDWERVFNYSTYSDGTYTWLRLPWSYSDNRQIRVIGTAPLSTLAAYTDTTEIDGREVDLLLAYAAYCLFRNEEGVPSSEDTSRYVSRAMRWLGEYERLKPSLRMVRPRGTLLLPRL